MTTSAGAPEAKDSIHEVSVADFAASGTVVDHVPVAISYGIIERFSEGLYSSPNKTFEELVTNAYDAGAKEVWVQLPPDFTSPDASVTVIDDGDSMDLAGLKDLWRIGESSKRDTATQGQRKQVGKFGIGKLATYVLANELTYIAARDDEYLAVTMDYRVVAPGSTELTQSVGLELEVRQLSHAEVLDALESRIQRDTPAFAFIERVRSRQSSRSWTAAIMTSLKEKAYGIEIGRLRWILRTALPLNPNFTLHYNTETLTPSKLDGKTTWAFRTGASEDELPASGGRRHSWHQTTGVNSVSADGETVRGIKLPGAGFVWGEAHLFEKALDRGKSEDRARSHGFFIRVRGRLINLDQADFSLGPELHHGTLTRFHMEVNADELDEQVASARESLKEGPELSEFKSYLLAIFNRARTVLKDQDSQEKIRLLSRDGRLSDPPAALSEGPLRRLIQHALEEDESTREALGVRVQDTASAAALVANPGALVERVILGDDGIDGKLVTFDADKRAAVVNQQHPFFSNYASGSQNTEALKLLGLTELLTQAYLLDEGVNVDTIARVFHRRDRFLRALVERFPRSALVIADYLRRSSNNKDRLEEAVGDALELFGYDVRRIGGSTHGTDGIATARLGSRDGQSSMSYAFTYDAKSSGKDAVTDLVTDVPVPRPSSIRADTARTSILRIHRENAAQKFKLSIEPGFTLLVAPGFQGTDIEEGQIHQVCENDQITAITVENLARLVELFPLQGLTPADLRKLFQCHSPAETAEWVSQQSEAMPAVQPPVAEIVEILTKFSDRKAPMRVPSLAAYLNSYGIDLDENQVTYLVRGMQALAPKTIYTDGQFVALNASGSAFLSELRETLDGYDQILSSSYRLAVDEAEQLSE